MKVNKAIVAGAGLELLNEVGLEQLTLRRLATKLNVQAAAIYWHFKDKQELLDEMATTVLVEGASGLVPRRPSADWQVWASTYGHGLRKTLLAYRDGARMVSGTRLTSTEPLKAGEAFGARMIGSHFALREAVVLLSTIYNYTLSFVMEEQAVFPTPGMRSPLYALEARRARLDPALFPHHRQANTILFDGYNRRYKEGLALIIAGAEALKQSD
ncbi:TetR/AcrR family transcriptional regulator C-terminal domain-containing protein [Acidipila sp. EB88]|uniref:TetR/AcrR family transcriptional regulator C-terminal domain-containing protein n=1 Tax=Acidipila sp. EB88 TaxID=2305226 RepID=UPI000F5EE453|nr:TetR/AcrR family transcriptional regulator C-terminal domain-containing protein [Acidipila sp. EB88]RRA49766.1 TetR family transcriptional regulator [Acidipila sp. EB88]